MTEEQESTKSIIIGFVLAMIVLFGIFWLVEVFPFLIRPILVFCCIYLILEGRRIWKRYKELKRNDAAIEGNAYES